MEPVEIVDPNVRFNVNKIMDDISQVIHADPDFCFDTFEDFNQISLRAQGGWFGGIGSLYDEKAKVFTDATENYTEWNPALAGTYFETVLKAVDEIAEKDGKKIGRARIMRMPVKSCLTLHTDPDEHRYHIPLQTNYGAFFVVGLEVVRMPLTGVVYRFKTNVEHTAVNASMKVRIHLVFDTY